MALSDPRRGDEALPLAWLNVIVITAATSRSRDNVPWPRHPGKLHRSRVEIWKRLGNQICCIGAGARRQGPRFRSRRLGRQHLTQVHSKPVQRSYRRPFAPFFSTIGYFARNRGHYGFGSASTTRCLIGIPVLRMARHHRYARQGALSAGLQTDQFRSSL